MKKFFTIFSAIFLYASTGKTFEAKVVELDAHGNVKRVQSTHLNPEGNGTYSVQTIKTAIVKALPESFKNVSDFALMTNRGHDAKRYADDHVFNGHDTTSHEQIFYARTLDATVALEEAHSLVEKKVLVHDGPDSRNHVFCSIRLGQGDYSLQKVTEAIKKECAALIKDAPDMVIGVQIGSHPVKPLNDALNDETLASVNYFDARLVFPEIEKEVAVYDAKDKQIGSCKINVSSEGGRAYSVRQIKQKLVEMCPSIVKNPLGLVVGSLQDPHDTRILGYHEDHVFDYKTLNGIQHLVIHPIK